MDPDSELRKQILETLTRKATLKQRVADNTQHAFEFLKETLHEVAAEIDEELDEKIDKRIRIEYRDRGKYEAQIQVAEDVLIFAMHTDVYRFHEDHPVWENNYVKEDIENAYCGMISIYNFLADSFKFNRATDEGYLVGRIFINHKSQYFAEGKIRTDVDSGNFGDEHQIDHQALRNIIESAIHYSLEFDLYVPPYEENKLANVEQFNTRNENSKLRTGKLLGFGFDCGEFDKR